MSGILAAGTAFALGAMHALEPGHGKSFITAFMIGNRGNLSHVVTLGLSLAFSHTLLLLFLGFFLNIVLSSVENESVEHALEIASPLLLIGLGIFLLFRLRNGKKHVCCNHDHLSHHEHTHRSHSHDHNHPHSHHKHESKVSHKLSAIAGFTGGLLPCPSAIAAFIFSGNTGSFTNSLGFILIYVAGLISVLIGIAFIIFITKNRFERFFTKSIIAKNAELISAILIVIVGCVYLIKSLVEHL